MNSGSLLPGILLLFNCFPRFAGLVCSIKQYCEVLPGRCVVQSSAAGYSRCVKQECPIRVRVFYTSVSENWEGVFSRVCHKSVEQNCQAESYKSLSKSVPQECPTRVCHKSVTKECPIR